MVQFQSHHEQKVVTFANDLTDCVNIGSFFIVFAASQLFKTVFGLYIKPNTTEKLSNGPLLPKYTQNEQQLEVLRVPLWAVISRQNEISERLFCMATRHLTLLFR